MYSAEGEEVQLSFSIYPTSNVEDWLLEVEHSMKASVHDIIERAIRAYPTVSTPLLLGIPTWPSRLLPPPSSVPLSVLTCLLLRLQP
jgi:dynein heavy chain